MKKSIAVILVVMMILTMLVACAKPNDDNDTPSTSTPASDTTTDATADTTASSGADAPSGGDYSVKDDVSDTVRFDGKTINILYWKDVEQPEFYVDDITGDNVTDAIFNRNMTVEARLGVKLNFIGTEGNFGNQQNYVKQVQNSINSGGEYDIHAGYSLTGSTLAVNGYVQNLLNVEHLDFEKPWWPESLVGEATMNNKLYFASGDISTNMLHFMYAVFFNKEIIEKNSLASPYDLVANNEWTYAKMFELASNLYNDNNGNGTRDLEDSYGMCSSDIHMDAYFGSAALKTVEKDANDNLIISPTFNSERTLKVMEEVCDFMWNTGDYYHGETGKLFSAGNTLFVLDRAYMSLLNKDRIMFEYGIVPVPKYESSQDRFITVMAFPYTMYSISVASKNTEAAGATLEVLCSEGYRQVTPELFETSMKLKYSSDNQASQMYDIIRENVSFDLGRLFCTELKNYSYTLFRDTLRLNVLITWSSRYKGASKVMSTALDKINSAIDALD